jgi:hypothetical protein
MFGLLLCDGRWITSRRHRLIYAREFRITAQCHDRTRDYMFARVRLFELLADTVKRLVVVLVVNSEREMLREGEER